MNRLARRGVALVIIGGVAAASCTVSTYGYQVRVRQSSIGAEEPDVPSPEARQLLATATTVAFYPPDVCLNTDTQASERVQQLRANCGVLLSTLERAAEHAGYEVYSWQNLRGGRAIDFAREAKVDVLFEINEFDLGAVDSSATARTLTFFEQDEHGAAVPLNVSEQLAQRCRVYAGQTTPLGADALTGTIDIKTVSVSDGRSRWRYRKTLSQSAGREYPPTTFSAPRGTNRAVPALGGIGLGALIVGAVFVGVGSGSGGSNDVDLTPLGKDMLIIGVVGVAAAVALAVATGGQKPNPDDVMCNGSPTPPVSMAVAPQATGPVSAEHTFTESTPVDPLVEQKQQIRDTMIAQFISVLKDARGNRPSGPPPQFPAPAPAPVAPPPAP